MNALRHPTGEVVIRHGHMACGIGAGAKGMSNATPRVGPLRGRFECAGGIDVDAGAIRNFELMTGVKGTVMDLFDEAQYRAFHGKAPPAGWREATPRDIRTVLGRLDILFASYPCKGFSGLLSARAAETAKYQALNELTKRGMMLSLEAYADDPVPIVAFENVPRIASQRGAHFLAEIDAMYRAYGYVVSEVADSVYDCGVIGGLGQSRKRFLRLYRHPSKIPNFIYQPERKRLRGVGEIIGKLPLPADPVAGVMHRVPALQWKTWVRLAFVPAGKDWRALNDLAVVDGHLRDFGIVPDRAMRENALGVLGWKDSAPVLTSARSPAQGRFSVADPRVLQGRGDTFGVRPWSSHAHLVAGASRPANGAHNVADPRPLYGANTHRHVLGVHEWRDTAFAVSGNPKPSCGAYAIADVRYGARDQTLGVTSWTQTAGTLQAKSGPTNGAFSVADPRVAAHPRSVQLGVRRWGEPSACLKADVSVGTGPYAVSDPRMQGKPRFNNVFRIVPYERSAPAVAGPGGPAGGLGVADPRAGSGFAGRGKYRVTSMRETAGTIIGASTTGQGAFAVADPRPTHGTGAHHNKMRVVAGSAAAPTITGSDRVGSGALSVADPRPHGLGKASRDQHGYNSQAHYGVLAWNDTSVAVPGYAKYDRGKWSVADPREVEPEPLIELPAPNDRLVARIISTDETWHRPFTTLELAALQSLFEPEETFRFDPDTNGWSMLQPFDLEGTSDATKREWIGNAVPSAAARAMAEEIGEAILLSRLGETFTLSSKAIWVSPVHMALAVDQHQVAFEWDQQA